MKLSPDISSMLGPDFSIPRKLGAFVICINPTSFVTKEIFISAMQKYLNLIRTSESLPKRSVMAPGDREWKVFEKRKINGIPLDPQTENDFKDLSKKYGVKLPWISK